MQQGAFHKAVRMYTKALELDPGNAILYSNRSAAHFHIRQFSESLEDAESAILCDGMWWKAYKRKGLALIHMQRYEEAIQALEDGLKIVGKNAEMEKNLEFARACQEQAQNLYILPEAHMMQRLESVPVFIVTDSGGQPFFVTYDDGQQVCTFYFDKKDAVATLDWIKSENPALGDTARVIHITLHQAFNLAQETQKQYYEETTRAAAEEDRRAALEAEKKAKDGKEADNPSLEKTELSTSASTKHQGEEDWEDSTVSNDDKDDATVKELPSHAVDDGSKSANSSLSKANLADKPEAVVESEKAKEDEQVVEGTLDGERKDDDEKGSAEKAPDVNEDDKKEVDDNEAVDNEDDGKDGEEKEGEDIEDKNIDDAIIDENAPLSFQFRPELRQVQVAVELLNKNPNPPVRPILRDPPSVRKAKAEAKAKADAEAKAQTDSESKEESEENSNSSPDQNEGATVSEGSDNIKGSLDKPENERASEENISNEGDDDASRAKNESETAPPVSTTETVETRHVETENAEVEKVESADNTEVKTTPETVPNEDAKSEMTNDTTDKHNDNTASAKSEGNMPKDTGNKDETTIDKDNSSNRDVEEQKKTDVLGEDDDVELTVDNFNGIPIFQAKGLTLLQRNKQLIPLFFSKWDLEDAWMQLKNTNASGVPGECEVEVGTLEDVLRRMSECKTDEFDSVFFVPSREAMRAINVKFPLDELSPPSHGARRNTVRRGGLSRAKQIAARGGTKEEIRAAIVEDLRKHEERQKMAEVVSQIEHARRLSGVGGLGGVGFGNMASSSSNNSARSTTKKTGDGIKV